MDGLATLTVFAAVLSVALTLRARSANPATAVLFRLGKATPLAPVEAVTTRRSMRFRSAADSNFLFDNPAIQWLETVMLQAAIYSPLSNVLMLMAALLVGGAASILLITGDPLIAGAGGIALFLAPIGYIKFRQMSRVKAFGQQLPEVLDMIKSSLEAGHSLHRALQVVAEEFTDPVQGEIRIVLEQTRLGVSLPRAFEEMLGRMPEESLNFLVVAIKIQAEVGSSLAEIVGRLAETVRARLRIRLQIKALTAQPRMSGMLVGMLPFFVLGVFMFIQPSYTMMLFRDPIGIKILKTAIALDLTALIIIRKILRTDY
jgi:tight adherence protein B